MSRSLAAVLFVTLYAVAIGIVCMVNADAILRDAVVGVSLVAGLYMMFFLPTAAAGAAAVALNGMNGRTRFTLAVGFALLLGVLLQTLFATSQTQHFGPAVLEWGMVLI